MKYIRKKTLVSTNLYAAELLEKGKITEATIIIANEQRSGRGHGENSWESKAGENLTFSLVLFPDFIEASEQFLISTAVSLAIAGLIEEFTKKVKVKWPNDIYVGNDKICGILIENSVLGTQIASSIIGVGLNVNQEKFESDAPNPISLKQITGKTHDLNEILRILLYKIESYMAQLKNNQEKLLRANYISKLFRYNEVHSYIKENEKFKAKISGIDNFGHLFLEKENKEVVKYMFKEIEFVI